MASVSASSGAKLAVTALHVKAGDQPVILFRSGPALAGGTVVSQAGSASAPGGKATALGVVQTKTKPIFRVAAGHRAFLFYADLAPYQAYSHRGRLALVDVSTGKVRVSSTLSSPPVIDGRLPFYMRSAGSYNDPKNHVFTTPYKITTGAAAATAAAQQKLFTYRIDRSPLSALAIAKQAADQLAADHACSLRVSDTFGEFYDFTGADQTRARLGDLFFQLNQLNPGFIDQRYSRTSGLSPLQALEALITGKGCKDIFLYVAGRGYSVGAGTTIGIGTRVSRGGVKQQLFNGPDLKAFIAAHPGVNFSVELDAPYSKGIVDSIAAFPNVLIGETGAGATGTSFGYLPEVFVNGKRIANTGNPDGLLEFTNRTISGLNHFLSSADEVAAAIAARKAGTAPSFLAVLLGRAFSLGSDDDLPSVTGIQKPFFTPTVTNPHGPPPAPTPTTPSTAPAAKPPFASDASVTTAEDTPLAIALPGSGPGNAPVTFSIQSGPQHGTLSGTGQSQTYTPAADFAGTDSFVFKVTLGALSATGTVTITVTPVNDPPAVNTSTGSPTFTEAGPAVVIDPGVTVSDVDNTTLAGATAAITTGRSVDDLLAFTDQNGITGSYAAGTGVLTLTGSATVAQYQAALRSITFAITGANPAAGTRTVSFSAADAAGSGPASTRDVTVVTVDDAPVLTGSPSTLAYTENGPATPVGPGTTIADPDSPTLTSATATITGNYQSAEDRLSFTAASGITGSFNTGTGTLTLTGSATVAAYETALANIQYANLSDAPSTAARTISVSVNDGQLSSNTVTSSVTVAAVDDAPVVATGSVAASYTENASPVVVDPSVTVADPDNASLTGATASITTGLATGEDALAFTATATITGTYNALTGVLTLTGTDTVAAYQAVLRSVTYVNSSDNPSTTTRVVAFTATDGSATSTPATTNVDVTAVNDAPTVGTSAGFVTYTEGATATLVDSGIAVADLDNASLVSATVTISAGLVAGDQLGFTNQNGISGTYTAGTGTLALTGASSVGNYQTALASITYSTTSDDPTSAARTVSFTVSDGALSSTAATRSVHVVPTNDPPVLTTSADPDSTYTEGQAGSVVVDGSISTADPDNTTLASATVTIAAGDLQTGDTLTTGVGVLPGGVTANYTPGTGVLAIAGVATVTQYEAILRSVGFRNTRTDLSDGSRSISLVVNDGAASSAAVTRTVNFASINSAPTLTAGVAVSSWTEGAAPAAVDTGIVPADPDDTFLESAVVRITTNAAAGDLLDFTTQNGITGVYSAGTHTLALTGHATIANYQTALRSIAYESTDDNVSSFTRTVTFTVNDGALDSNTTTHTVAVVPTNDAPTVTTSANAANTFTEGDATGAVVDSGLTVTDPDSANMASATATIALADFQTGDVLAAPTLLAGATANYVPGTRTLTITGGATLAQYQTMLRSITYSSNRTDIPSGTRSVAFSVNDGGLTSAAASHTVNYAALNTAPALTNSGGNTAYSEGGAPVAVDSTVNISDPDDTNVKSATVIISSPALGDVLGFTNQFGITGTYTSATGTLVLAGVDTIAHYQTALRSVTFANTTNDALTTATRSVAFEIKDPADAVSPPSSKNVAVTAVNDAPTVTLSGSTPTFTEGDPELKPDTAITVTDPDSANAASAEVKITAPVAGDTLAIAAGYTLPSGITLGGTATDLTLTGAATPANYADALSHVTFFTASTNPTSANRTVRFTVSDGTDISAPADKTVTVVDVNSPPVATADAFTTNEDTVKTANVITNNDSDPDDAQNTLVVDRVAGAAGNVGNQITLPSGAKVTIGSDGSLSYDPNNQFNTLQVGDPNATDSVTYRISDPHGSASSTVTVTFTITPVNDAPTAPTQTYNVLRNTAFELKDAAGGAEPKVKVTGDLLTAATDVDNAQNTLTVTNQNISSANGGTVDLDADGTFVYVSKPGDAAPTDTFSYELKDPNGGLSNETVNLNLQGHIWYVDPAASAIGANGTSTHPFLTVGAAEASAATNEQLYVASGSVSGAATLKAGQDLLGEGDSFSKTLVTDGNPGTNDLPVGSVTVAAAGTRPVLTTTGSAVVSLSTGNNLKGFDVDPDGAADGINGTNTGTTTITDVHVSDAGTATSGDGIDLSGASTAATLDNVDVTTNGSGTGLRIAGSAVNANATSDVTAVGGPAIVTSGTLASTLALGSVSTTNSASSGVTTVGAGSFSATSLTVANPATTGVVVGGSGNFTATNAANTVSGSGGIGFQATTGTGTVQLAGNITPDPAKGAVDVQNRSGASAVTVSASLTTTGIATGVNVANNSAGTVTLSGTTKSITSSTAKGVTLASNTGSTVNFTNGGLAITSTSGNGFEATGGGTFTVQGSGNSVASTTGTAVNVTSTTIGAADATFQSVSSNGASTGINLSSTGATGGLHVTGTGSSQDTTGGIIQNATGEGVTLSSTSDVSLQHVRVTTSGNNGIKGTNVDGLTFAHGSVLSSGNVTGESNVNITQLTGTSLIDDSSISTPDTDNIHINNSSGTATIGVTNNTITMDPTRADVQNDSVLINGSGGTVNATIAQNTITGAAGDHVQIAPSGTAVWTADIHNNTMTSGVGGVNGEDLGGGVTISPAALSGSLKYKVDANVITGDNQGSAVTASQSSGTGAVNGEINGNTLGTFGSAKSASAQGSGITIDQGGENVHTIQINNNTIDGYGFTGINLSSGQGPTTDGNTGQLLNATITNNVVRGPDIPNAFAGLYLDSGVMGTQNLKTCLSMSGNTIRSDALVASGGFDVRLTQDSPGGTVTLPGYAGATNNLGQLQSFLAAQNGSIVANTSVDTTVGTFTGGAACPLPSLF